MTLRTHEVRRPHIYIAEAEYDRLAGLAQTAATTGARLLSEELARALIVKPRELPRVFVRLDSKVEFTDLLTGRKREVQLVLPEHADIDKGRISVLSPVGAALIGLTPGDSFGMTSEDGRSHVLKVERVEPAAVSA